ncbi:hypothetical protein GCM10027579_12740 [Calidifontibacter terrae]
MIVTPGNSVWASATDLPVRLGIIAGAVGEAVVLVGSVLLGSVLVGSVLLESLADASVDTGDFPAAVESVEPAVDFDVDLLELAFAAASDPPPRSRNIPLATTIATTSRAAATARTMPLRRPGLCS